MSKKIFWSMVIPFGKANAITCEKLAMKVNVSVKTLKPMIRKARLNGSQICSCPHGYYFPKDDAEMKAYIDMQERQAKARLKTIKHIKKMIRVTKGQICIDDYLGPEGNQTLEAEE